MNNVSTILGASTCDKTEYTTHPKQTIHPKNPEILLDDASSPVDKACLKNSKSFILNKY